MKFWPSKGPNITEMLGTHINGHSGEVAIGIMKMNCHLRDLIRILDLLVATETISGTRDGLVTENSETEETITEIFGSSTEMIMMIEVMRNMIGGITIEMLESSKEMTMMTEDLIMVTGEVILGKGTNMMIEVITETDRIIIGTIDRIREIMTIDMIAKTVGVITETTGNTKEMKMTTGTL